MHVTNKDSLPGGEEEGGMVGELRNVACHKRGLTNWRGGRERSRLVSLETWHVTNEDSHPGGEEEGGAGWWGWKSGGSKKRGDIVGGGMRKKQVGELWNEARRKCRS